MGIVIQKLRDSARGQPCMLRIPHICNGDPATTVLAHAPSDSKAMGTKSHDFIAVFSCSACHEYVDQNRGLRGWREFYWREALQRTWAWWVENGYIKIVGDNDDAKPRVRKLSKVVPHSGRMRR